LKTKLKRNKNKLKFKGLDEREFRIKYAPEWVLKRGGKSSNLLKKYKKKFKIDLDCAIFELIELGIIFNELYLVELRNSYKNLEINKKKHIPITKFEFDRYHGNLDNDENFSFIVGYTSNGFPYGTLWE